MKNIIVLINRMHGRQKFVADAAISDASAPAERN